MAYRQGYDIEYGTNSYVILKKSIYDVELKEWEDRKKGEKK